MKYLYTIILLSVFVLGSVRCDELLEILDEEESEEYISDEEGVENDTPQETTSTSRNTIIAEANKHLGVKYTYGGASPEKGFDCSGFVLYCYSKAGISLPHKSSSQYTGGKKVEFKDAKPADVLAFYSPITHVGIFLGENKMIHSPKTGDVVKIVSMEGYWSEKLAGTASYIDSASK